MRDDHEGGDGQADDQQNPGGQQAAADLVGNGGRQDEQGQLDGLSDPVDAQDAVAGLEIIEAARRAAAERINVTLSN